MGSISLDHISNPAMRSQAQAKYAEATGKPKVAPKPKGAAVESELEASLLGQLRMTGLPKPTRQLRFAIPRRFAWDFAWPEAMLAVECDGATYANGRHTRGDGFASDCEKCNLGTLLGWRVLRFDKAMVLSGAALATIRTALERKP